MAVAATTELEAINIMLAAIAEAPINSLTGTLPVDAVTARSTLAEFNNCLLYTSPSPRDLSTSRMPSSA